MLKVMKKKTYINPDTSVVNINLRYRPLCVSFWADEEEEVTNNFVREDHTFTNRNVWDEEW